MSLSVKLNAQLANQSVDKASCQTLFPDCEYFPGRSVRQDTALRLLIMLILQYLQIQPQGKHRLDG